MTILAHKIRLDLNNTQTTWFERCAGTARFTYNWGLARWHERYVAGDRTSWQSLDKELNSIKKTEFPWLTELPWKIPSGALMDLGRAFQHFFQRVKNGSKKPGYPKFKKKGRAKESFCIEGRAFKFGGKQVRIPKLGWVRMREEIRFPGRILSVRFSRRDGKWYASFAIEIDESRWVYPHRCETQATVGVDLGVVDLAVLSDGTRVKAPRSFRRYEKRLRQINKELSRRTRGGKNWNKAKLKLSRLHERIANVRKDVIHKLTTRLVRDFRFIGIENLNVKGMTKNRHLAKSVLDASFFEVRRQLEYKAQLSGSTVVVADRWFPSSKTCSACGAITKKLPLSVREWVCAECGVVHDRDENASFNLQNLAAANAVTACCPGSAGPVLRNRTKLPVGQESSYCVRSA